jgi:hypothetical protein
MHCSYHNNGAGADLPNTEFYDSQNRWCCKECFKAQRRARYDKQGSSLHDMYCTNRARATRRGIPFELTEAEFAQIIAQPCFYAINWHAGIRSGLDRQEPRLGYTVANCVPCCAKHNLFKSFILTTEQTKDAVRRYQVSCENTLAGRKKSARILPDTV